MLVRDLFRHHIISRKNSNELSLLMRASDIQKMKDFKEDSIKILNQFNALNCKFPSDSDHETFGSLNEFMINLLRQQEELRSEVWKLENFVDNISNIAQEQHFAACSSMEMKNESDLNV